MSVRCPDCHEQIVFGTEHLGGCRYITLSAPELSRVVFRRQLANDRKRVESLLREAASELDGADADEYEITWEP